MEKVLITGINGFVGSHLAIDQLSKGRSVIGIDVHDRQVFDEVKECKTYLGDIRDEVQINKILQEHEISRVFHLAGNSIVKKGLDDPIFNYDLNIMGTVKLLEGIRKFHPKAKVVVASTDKAYGNQEKMPFHEGMKLNPDCPYATSKACTDMISQSYGKTFNMDIMSIRCSNIYGPGDLNSSRLIPNSILRVLEGEKPMIYSGVAQYRREFIYISDVCSAYDLLAEKGQAAGVYNIGVEEYFTIEEAVQQISDLMGAHGIDIVEKSFPETRFQWMDGSKLMQLGWAPEVNFTDGLKKSIDWYTHFQKTKKEVA